MNKKVVGGLLAVLFVVSFVQTGAILKMQKVASAPKAQSVVIENSNQNQAATVISSQKAPNVILEEYVKTKYPKDHLTRIQRINSKVEALLVANGLNEGDTAVQKNIFHRILCGIMGGNYYQEYMGGGAYCARMEVGLPYALPTTGSGNTTGVISERTKVQDIMGSNYLKDAASYDASKILVVYDGVQKILQEEGVDTKFLGGPGFRRFLCRLFGGEWGNDVIESGEATIWVQSCLWN